MTIYRVIRTQKEFEALKLLLKLPLFCDTETCEELGKTTPGGGLYGRVRLFQLYQQGWTKAVLIDCFFIPLEQVLELVQAHHHIYHNASYDLHTINCHTPEVWLPSKVDDTFYLSKAAFSYRDKFDFYSCLHWAGVEDDRIRSIDKKANQKANWSKALTHSQLEYAACDVLYLSLLWEVIKKSIDRPYKLDIANLQYAINYTRRGLAMNQAVLADMRQEQILLLEKHTAVIPCNINSYPQCAQWLGVPSTKAEILADMALNGNQDANNLRLARQAYKILGFVEKYDRPRMRSFFNACGARTSRMTATGGDRYGYDNLQNPPRILYKAMQAPQGHKYVYADFSGLELRMVGAYIGEPELERLYKAGVDVHARTGSVLFDCKETELTKIQRVATKIVSFITIYGGGKLRVQGGMQVEGGIRKSLKEIGELQRSWLELYSAIADWHSLHAKALQVYGYIDTVSLLGRVMRATSYAESFNLPIQASGAEATKLSLYYLHQYPEVPPVANVVHDAIALLAAEGAEATIWGKRLTDCMQRGWRDVVKFSAIPDMPMVADTIISTKLGVRDTV